MWAGHLQSLTFESQPNFDMLRDELEKLGRKQLSQAAIPQPADFWEPPHDSASAVPKTPISREIAPTPVADRVVASGATVKPEPEPTPAARAVSEEDPIVQVRACALPALALNSTTLCPPHARMHAMFLQK